MSIPRWARARRLSLVPLQLLMWPLLANPKKILRFLATAFVWGVFRTLGLKRHLKHFEKEHPLSAYYGLPLDEAHVAFYIPGIGRLIFPSDAGWIVNEVIGTQVYDRFFKLAPNSIVLDIGAHAGAFTAKMAKRVRKGGRVIAVEPHPGNFNFLTQNIRINKLQNVLAFNLALGGKTGKTKLYLANSTFTPSTVSRTSRWLEVPVETLANLLRKLNLRRVNFIKIDAEGAELEILQGGEDFLNLNGLKLSIAAYHTASEARHVTEFLKARGFTVWSVNGLVYAIKAFA